MIAINNDNYNLMQEVDIIGRFFCFVDCFKYLCVGKVKVLAK